MSELKAKPAVLTDDEIEKVRTLEHELGDSVAVVAYAKPLVPAELTAAKLKRLRQLEQELGDVCLVAWQQSPMVCE
jgi:hypothetical protein